MSLMKQYKWLILLKFWPLIIYPFNIIHDKIICIKYHCRTPNDNGLSKGNTLVWLGCELIWPLSPHHFTWMTDEPTNQPQQKNMDIGIFSQRQNKWACHFPKNTWGHLLQMVKSQIFRQKLAFWKTYISHHELNSFPVLKGLFWWSWWWW